MLVAPLVVELVDLDAERVFGAELVGSRHAGDLHIAVIVRSSFDVRAHRFFQRNAGEESGLEPERSGGVVEVIDAVETALRLIGPIVPGALLLVVVFGCPSEQADVHRGDAVSVCADPLFRGRRRVRCFGCSEIHAPGDRQEEKDDDPGHEGLRVWVRERVRLASVSCFVNISQDSERHRSLHLWALFSDARSTYR